jgi:hypothetical protein
MQTFENSTLQQTHNYDTTLSVCSFPSLYVTSAVPGNGDIHDALCDLHDLTV